MRKTLIATVALAALLTLSNVAMADPESAGYAAAVAAAGAAVSAGVGGTVGASSTPRTRAEVIIEHPARPTTERNCVCDSAGNVACRELRR